MPPMRLQNHLLRAGPPVDHPQKGRFEAREGWSEAEPFFLARWHAGAFRPVGPACDDADRAHTVALSLQPMQLDLCFALEAFIASGGWLVFDSAQVLWIGGTPSAAPPAGTRTARAKRVPKLV